MAELFNNLDERAVEVNAHDGPRQFTVYYGADSLFK
jgi:hypothetical protein